MGIKDLTEFWFHKFSLGSCVNFLKRLLLWEVIAVLIMTSIAHGVNDLSAWYTIRMMTCIFLLLNITALAAAHIFECYGAKGNASFFQFIARKWNEK